MSHVTPNPVGAGISRSNQQLLAAYRRGDRASAELLVERTYGVVYASAFKLCGDAAQADDLTQETYRKAWQSLDRFEGRCKVSTWLYRITYTTFLNSIRSLGREAPLSEEVIERTASGDPSAEDVLHLSGRSEVTREAVLALPETLRATVTARYWAGLPVSEIAREEGVTPVAIRKRLKKALALLAQVLEENQP